MDEQQLAEITARCAVWQRARRDRGGATSQTYTIQVLDALVGQDVPALVAEVQRLRAEVAGLVDFYEWQLRQG